MAPSLAGPRLGSVAGALLLGALRPAAPASTAIVITHECGDLPTCPFQSDGHCDDGGPGAAYWSCPRYSDATDCGTRCDDGRAPPPPPSCSLAQFARSATASSFYSALYSPSQATGAPTHPLVCAAQAGSWAPAHRTSAANWLEVRFAFSARPETLTVWQHANPASASGFVSAVDLVGDDGVVYPAWTSVVDDTVCGSSLVLLANDLPVAIRSTRVVGARIHTRTPPTAGSSGGRSLRPASRAASASCARCRRSSAAPSRRT